MQTHHAQSNETLVVNPSNFSLDKEISLQNYHPSLLESYREKFLNEQKLVEASFLHKFNPSVFTHLHPYSKNLNLSTLHENINNRAQSDENQQQTMRVKNLYSLTNEVVPKSQNDSIAQPTVFKSQNIANNLGSNDRNNNKNSGSTREKIEQNFETSSTAEKSHVIHLNSKSGVSLKCAYCEAREDFKTR